MIRLALATACCALLLGADARTSHAGELSLTWEGETLALADGLSRTADGATWISAQDLRSALGVHVKRLIPRPLEGKRPRPQLEKDSWVLCGEARCGTYRGKTLGTEERPTFDLAHTARTLGYRLRSRGDVLSLSSPRTGRAESSPQAHIGSRVADLAFPCLDGQIHRIAAHRGRRLLLVSWSSWSRTRADLENWRAAWKQRAEAKLDLWFVAVDIAGDKYVRDYVGVGFDAPVGIDRNADLTRRFGLNDVGRWWLLDELGILRAEGERFGDVDLNWIDLHLAEPLTEASPPLQVRARRLPEDLEALRAHVAGNARDLPARLALAEALEATQPAEARKLVEALVEQKPRSIAFPFRLARMHLDGGDLAGCLTVLDEVRHRLPHAWLVRKQYWALEEPARFYAGEIDLAWQQKKRKEEDQWLRRRRRR